MRTARARSGAALAAAALASSALAATAAAAPTTLPATTTSLTAPEAVARVCHSRQLPGAEGVVRRRWKAPVGGVVTARLPRRGAGDWDLALFDAASGTGLGASATFGSAEVVSSWVTVGQEVVVQVCRRSGRTGRVPLSIQLVAAERPASRGRIALVSVGISGQADAERLDRLGFDLTEHGGEDFVEVVTYSDAERARLRRAGFSYRTRIADLAAQERADRAADAAYARRVRRSPLPSARTTYRTFADYGTDLKRLVDEHPGLVRPVTLPHTNPSGGSTIEARPIEGIEIAKDVNRTDDGRPVLVIMGLHHAREWPSGELTIEFGIDLARSYGSDPRVTAALERARVFILPMINPDGFVVSRGAGTTPADDNSNATLGLVANDQGPYKRKNCRPTVPGSSAQPCAARTASGVDLNRNYGAYWGGVGSSSDVTSQSYRGTGPYSEPESEAVHRWSSGLHIATIITNHTFTSEGTFLRQPGFDEPNDEVPPVVPDEAPMRALGDAMRGATGYLSQLGWKLGDITGATEDWNYFAQGTIGYTPELRGTNFHMNYANGVVGEYEGEEVAARGPDPTPEDPSEDAVLAGDFRGKGIREAFLLAVEQAGNPADHSVIEGTAPPGRVLRLRKAFTTPTSQAAITVSDTLDTTLTVPASGRYEWHVNPSTRPLSPVKEAWTMTCEDSNGVVFDQREVVVDRGQRVTVDLPCLPVSPGPGGPGVDPAGLGRRLLVSRRSVRLTRTGGAPVVLSCRSTRPCRGTVRLRTAERFRRGRRVQRIALGRRSFTVPARRRVRVPVRLGAAGRRLLAREGALRVLVVANMAPGASGDRTYTKTATFRLVRARR